MTVDDVARRHQALLSGYNTRRLALIPATWLRLLDAAPTKIENSFTPEELAFIRIEDVIEKYSSLRIDANYERTNDPRWQEIQETLNRICVEAEDASEA